ncbi:MAG: TIR domain-containing protein [Chloroflexota bacterium]|nr:TIR domain-containing protein [Chloroflexota bacterium]
MNLPATRVIIIDDEPDFCEIMRVSLQSLGCETEISNSITDGEQRIEDAARRNVPFQVATIDMRFVMGIQKIGMPLGQQMLQYIKQNHPQIACIMISGSGVTPDEVLDLRDKYGLEYFLHKDRLDLDRLSNAIQRATERNALMRSGYEAHKLGTTFAATSRTSVFISYNRRLSWGAARAIANSLREHGIDVFLDLDEINVGRFKDVIEQQISMREYFIPILSPGTLESEWVQNEIARALVLNKKIIPLLCDDLSSTDLKLPVLLQDLVHMNAINLKPEFYDNAIQKLVNWCTEN